MSDTCMARCLICGAVFRLDLNGDWHCPACGAYDGNGHIEWIEEGEIKMAEQSTYVIFPRDFYKWRWYKEPHTVHLYVYLIMSARTERGGYRTVTIDRGQLFTTLERISEETGLSVAEVRTGINRLTRTGEIKCETYPFGRLIAVTDFEQFMEDDA